MGRLEPRALRGRQPHRFRLLLPEHNHFFDSTTISVVTEGSLRKGCMLFDCTGGRRWAAGGSLTDRPSPHSPLFIREGSEVHRGWIFSVNVEVGKMYHLNFKPN